MPVDLRFAEDEVDAVMVFRALKEMHAEGGVPGSFDDLKTLTHVLRLIKGPGSAVLMAMAGDELAGILLIAEGGFWYNNDRELSDKGFFVRESFRKSDAARVLLDGAKTASEAAKLPIYITIINGQRKRGAGSGWERVGATLGFTPLGAVMAHFPEI